MASPSAPLPVSFVLLPTTLTSPSLTPLLKATLNGVPVYRTLDPEPGEPFVSSSHLLLSQSLSPMLALTRWECRLPLGYDITLAGLAPFPDIWIPLVTARQMARELGILEPLRNLLSWKTRAMASWFEGVDDGGSGVVAHNWRLPPEIVDPSIYSHQALASASLTSHIVLLPSHQTIRTLIDPPQLQTLLSSIPPPPHPTWPALIHLVSHAFEDYLSPLPGPASPFPQLLLPFFTATDKSHFSTVSLEDLTAAFGRRRRANGGEEDARTRLVWVRIVEALAGSLVASITGVRVVEVEEHTSMGKPRIIRPEEEHAKAAAATKEKERAGILASIDQAHQAERRQPSVLHHRPLSLVSPYEDGHHSDDENTPRQCRPLALPVDRALSCVPTTAAPPLSAVDPSSVIKLDNQLGALTSLLSRMEALVAAAPSTQDSPSKGAASSAKEEEEKSPAHVDAPVKRNPSSSPSPTMLLILGLLLSNLILASALYFSLHSHSSSVPNSLLPGPTPAPLFSSTPATTRPVESTLPRDRRPSIASSEAK